MKPTSADSKLAVLHALAETGGTAGATRLREKLLELGHNLQPRTVRLYLHQLDEDGLTRLVSRRRGRMLTERGAKELAHANIIEKVGFIATRIDSLVYRMSYDPGTEAGTIIANTALIPRDYLAQAVDEMRPVFARRLGMGSRLCIAREGEAFAGSVVPAGMALIGTVCSVTANGILLKHGIPVVSRFGGLLELQNGQPRRLVALMEYGGTTLDPLEAFIRARMTRVRESARTGSGVIGASFREVPAAAVHDVRRIKREMERAGLDGILAIGHPNQPLLEIPVTEGRAGVIISGGLNPIAVLFETRADLQFHSLADVEDIGRFPRFDAIRDQGRG